MYYCQIIYEDKVFTESLALGLHMEIYKRGAFALNSKIYQPEESTPGRSPAVVADEAERMMS